MWRTFVFMLIVQRTFTSSEQLGEGNIREPRQLRYDNCCPCPLEGEESVVDHSSSNARVVASDNNCPCSLASDSQAESSIFSPALRAVKTFTRPEVKKEEPKPLLQPEVGLASSVLEALRDATDQEYQEALARDAARNAFNVENSDVPESETKNIVNIILNPKSNYNTDLVPEASHLKETRCIHPPLGSTNSLQPLKFRPPFNIVREVLKLPKLTNNNLSHKRIFDMDGSASNLQESLLNPFKSNILEDIKTKSNLLKLRLFPNAINALRMNPVNNNYRNVNEGTENESNNCADSNYNLQTPNYKSSSILDHSQKPAHTNILTKMPSIGEVRQDSEDFLSLSSNPTKNVMKYNLRDNNQQQDTIKPFLDSTELLNSQIFDKIKVSRTKYLQEKQNMNTEQGSSLISKPESVKIVDEDTLSKQSFHNTDTEQQCILDSFKNFDLTPSPSEMNEDMNLEKEGESKAALDYDIQINGIGNNTVENADLHIKNVTFEEVEQTTVKDENLLRKEVDIIKLDDIKDLESGESTDENSNLRLYNNDCANTSDDDDDTNTRSSNINDQEDNQNAITAFPTDEDLLEVDSSNTQKLNILPNIRADILRTLENFKQANERIQEKLRSNVQDALQSGSLNSESQIKLNQSYVLPSPSNILEENTNEMTNDTNINTQDLQEMSDFLLDLSKLKEKNESSWPDSEQAIGKEAESNEIPNKHDSKDTIEHKDSQDTFVKSDFNSTDEPVDNNSKNDEEGNKYSCNGDLTQKISGDLNDEEKEMTAQASNAIPSRTPQLRSDSDVNNVQPQTDIYKSPISNIKNFLENVRSSVTDIFQNKKDCDLIDANDESDAATDNSLFLENALDNNLEQHVSQNERNHYSLSEKLIRDDKFKYDPDSSLRSYKARVATPQSLNINPLNPIYPSSNVETDILSSASQRSAIKKLKMPIEIPNNYDLKSIVRNINEKELIPKLPTQRNKIFPGGLPSEASNLAESFRSRTENSLKNIQNFLDLTFNDPHKIKESRILGESLMNRDNLLKHILKPYEKLDITKINSLNRKIPLPGSELFTPNRKNDVLNRSELNRKLNKNVAKTFRNVDSDNSKQLRPTSVKSLLLPNNKQIKTPNNEKLFSSNSPDEAKRFLISRLKADRPNNQQKVGILPHETKSESKKLLPKTFTKPPSLRNNIKLKPLKESKITISFTTTTRPDILETRLKPTTTWMDSLRSKTAATPQRLPKLTKQLIDKKPNFESRLKSSEPRTMASENFMSKVPVTQTKGDTPLLKQTASSERELKNFQDLNRDKLKYDGNRKTLDSPTFLTSKNNISRKNILKMDRNSDSVDTTQSASNDIFISDPLPTLDEPLKENVSYKCKMVCIKDILDATEKKI